MKKLSELQLLTHSAKTEKEKRELKKLKAETDRDTLKEYLERTGHAMPTTRREFMAAGISTMAGTIAVPSALSVLLNSVKANAAECGPTASAGTVLPKIITINPAGGMGINGVIIGLDNDENGQLLPSYRNMTMPQVPNVAQKYGAAWNASNPFYTTLTAILQKYNVQDNEVRAINIVNRTLPDTAAGRFGVQGFAFKLGYNGETLPYLGQTNSLGGGFFHPAMVNPMPNLNIKTFAGIRNATQIQGALATFSTSQKETLLKTINKMNERQLASLAGAGGAKQLNNLLQCAGIKNLEVLKSAGGGIDPRTDPQIAPIWNDAQVNPDNEFDLSNSPLNELYIAQVAIIYSTLTGATGTGTVVPDGSYDYHGLGLNESQRRDRYAGDMVGRTIASAKAMNLPCAVILNSDGSCGGDGGWAFDTFDGSHILFLFRPGGGIELKSSQIGAWGKDQYVNEKSGSGPGSNEQLLGAITMANIMKFAGLTDKIESITGLSPTDRNIKVL